MFACVILWPSPPFLFPSLPLPLHPPSLSPYLPTSLPLPLPIPPTSCPFSTLCTHKSYDPKGCSCDPKRCSCDPKGLVVLTRSPASIPWMGCRCCAYHTLLVLSSFVNGVNAVNSTLFLMMYPSVSRCLNWCWSLLCVYHVGGINKKHSPWRGEGVHQ